MKLLNLISAVFLNFFIFSLIVGSGISVRAASDLPSKVVLGFVPSEDVSILKLKGAELAGILESRLKVPFEVFVPSSYSGIIDGMKDKKVDYAFFTALTFVEAEKTAQAKVLLKKVWMGPFYYSAIIVNDDSAIKSIKDLKGKRFGFVDEKSTSGFLYPSAMLRKKKIDPEKYFTSKKFFGNHEAAIRALWKGDVDAVAVYADNAKATTGAWNARTTIHAGETKKVRTLWVSEPIPNDPFCVRNDFYEKYPRFTHDLMFALIDLQDEPDNVLQKLFGIKTMALATSRQYDPVRELLKYLKPDHGTEPKESR